MTDAGFEERSVFQSGKPARDELARLFKPFGGHDALSRVGIERRTVPVASGLEPPALEVGNAVELLAAVEPAGQVRRSKALVSGRHTEEKDLLASRKNAVAQEFGKDLGEPWPACESEHSCAEGAAGLGAEPKGASSAFRSRDGFRGELDPQFDGVPDDFLRRPSRHQHSALGFEQAPAHRAEIDLRVMFFELRPRKPFEWHAQHLEN